MTPVQTKRRKRSGRSPSQKRASRSAGDESPRTTKLYDRTIPRFRKPPVSEVAVGIQFQAPSLTPVHLGLYYQQVRTRFPTVQVLPPLPPSFETFASAPTVSMTLPIMAAIGSFQPRIWFSSQDGSSLIQLQSGRLFFNWRGGLNAYPHFAVVQAQFMRALNDLEGLAKAKSWMRLV